jgi:hypothetical protein
MVWEPKGPITAEEAMRRLNADPDYRAKVERLNAEHAADTERHRQVTEELREDLAAVGVEVDTIWDLVNAKRVPTAAGPVLATHLLERDYDNAEVDAIARALSSTRPAEYWAPLVDAYKTEQRQRAKDGLAIAVSGALTHDHLDEYLALIRDRNLGTSRILLLHPITRLREDWVDEFLNELIDDPDLKVQIPLDLQWRQKHRRM